MSSKSIQFKLTAATNVGCIRSNNEDNFIVCPDLSRNEWVIPSPDETLTLGEKGALLVVADGMGGMNAGEVASSIAVDAIRDFFTRELESVSGSISEDTARNLLASSVKFADREILKYAEEHPETEGMGTTVVMVWLLDGKAHVCWCGDSRAYSWHVSGGLKQLSSDHSYVQELVDSGKLEASLAFDHPDSNIITRSLGNAEKPAQPDILTYNIHQDESFLLCSDGLSGMLRDSEMEEILIGEASVQEWKGKLIQGALDAGGHDNVTLVLCRVVSGGVESERESERPVTRSAFSRAKRLNIILAVVLVLLLLGGGCWFFMSHRSEGKGNEGLLALSRGAISLKQELLIADSVIVRSSKVWTAESKAKWLHLFPHDSILTVSLFAPRIPEKADSSYIVVSAGSVSDTLRVYFEPKLPVVLPAKARVSAVQPSVKKEEAETLALPAEPAADELTEMPSSDEDELTETD